jgi:hypothetical protein
MRYKNEFPDYDDDLSWYISTVEPYGFVDASWHNDACPRLENHRIGVRIWVDYSDPNLRESCGYLVLGGDARYGVEVVSSDCISEEDFRFHDWARAAKKAKEFHDEFESLRQWYIDVVGYDPSLDDPSMGLNEIRQLVREYKEAERVRGG